MRSARWTRTHAVYDDGSPSCDANRFVTDELVATFCWSEGFGAETDDSMPGPVVCDDVMFDPWSGEVLRYEIRGSDCVDLDGDEELGLDPSTCPGGTDCDDTDPSIGTLSPETCNGEDDDCDGLIDATAIVDGDECPAGHEDLCGPQDCSFMPICLCRDNDCFCSEA